MIGFTLFVLGLVLIVLGLVPPIVSNFPKLRNPEQNGQPVWPKRQMVLLPILGALVWFANSAWFNAELGKYYATQDVFGSQDAALESGPHICLGCTVREYERVVPLKFAGEVVSSEEIRNNTSGEEKKPGVDDEVIHATKWKVPDGAIQPQEVRFNDAVLAYVSSAVTFEMPTNDADFMKMANAFPTVQILRDKVLIPAARQAKRNAARMLSAQDYFAGRGGEFEFAVRDQLENGIYVLEQTMITNNEENADNPSGKFSSAEAITQSGDRSVERGETVRYHVTIKRDSEGNPIRGDNPLARYGIKVAQATIEDVTPEKQFRLRLARQRDEAAKTNLARQGAIRAQFEREKVIAEGETEKAKKRIELEQKQIEIVIGAETEAKKVEQLQRQRITESETRRKQAEENEKAAVVEVRVADLESQARERRAKAEAYQREALMKADNALELRLRFQKETAVGVAAELAKSGQPFVPGMYFGSGANGQGNGVPNAMEALLGLKVMEMAGVSTKGTTTAPNVTTK